MFKEKQIKYANRLLHYTHENPKAQKYLSGRREKTEDTYETALLPKVAHIFKELFEEDILEEKVILEWAKKGVSLTKEKDRHKDDKDKSDKKNGSDDGNDNDDWGDEETEWIEDTNEEAIAKSA